MLTAIISICCILPTGLLFAMMAFNIFIWNQSHYWSKPEQVRFK